jgi:protein tyrosine/serine phosphatase
MKPTLRRILLAVLTAALIPLSGCSLHAPATAARPAAQELDRKGLARFEKVDDDVYRGSQPLSVTQLAELVNAYHFKTVLKLNGEVREPLQAGVKLIVHPLYGPVTPSAEEIETILEDIENAEKPLYIHCSHGEDRTGLIVALYRIRYGETADAAYRDMRLNGFHPYKGLWRAWVRETGWKGKPEAGLQAGGLPRGTAAGRDLQAGSPARR